MNVKRNAPTLLTLVAIFLISTPVAGQVFVKTLLDRRLATPASAIDVNTAFSNLPQTAQTQVGAFPANSTFMTLSPIQRDNLKDAILDETLKGLDTLTDEQALAVCDKVSSLLKNRWAPVKWKSERSVCFWNQPSFDWARAAQIAGSVDRERSPRSKLLRTCFGATCSHPDGRKRQQFRRCKC